MQPGRALFLHVPKCAGRSIRSALAAALCSPEEADTQWLRLSAPASAVAAELLGQDRFRLRDSLLAYMLSHTKARFVSGHFRVVPDIFDAFARDWNYVTLLREPVSRFVSEYYFNRFKPSDHCRIREGLAAFLSSAQAREMGAKYVRLFAGPEFARRPADDPEAIARAVANLSRFQVVGLFEDLPGFIRMLAGRTGIIASLPHLNPSPRPQGLYEHELTAETSEQIRLLCKPSQLVYAEACCLAQVQTD